MNNKTVKNDPRVIKGWTIYDWANSVFSLVIISTLFPVYYETVTSKASISAGLNTIAIIDGVKTDQYFIDVFGFHLLNTTAYSYALSFAFLCVAFLSPILSGISDYGGIKKKMMLIFVLLGSVSCAAMFFFNENNIEYGLIVFVLASIGFAGSLVYYNAFLPEIATPDRFDEISAKGFSMGYIGSVILMLICLVPIIAPQLFFNIDAKALELQSLNNLGAEEALEKASGFYKGLATRIAFILVFLWWFGFSRITFNRLPKEHKKGKITASIFLKGFSEIKQVFKKAIKMPSLNLFLTGHFLTSMGLQTTMYIATLFGTKEIFVDDPNKISKLILTIIIIQLVAIPGAYLFSKSSKKYGSFKTLMFGDFVWISICVSAYFIHKEMQFYVLATVVGLVMGGVQSLLRSTYAKYIPEDDTDYASYFSFYEFAEKIAIVLGTFAFGFINEWTGSMRLSALTLGLFFLGGFFAFAWARKLKFK